MMSLPTDQRKKYILGGALLLAVFAIIAVFHFTKRDGQCLPCQARRRARA
jgi:hypothetical protein